MLTRRTVTTSDVPTLRTPPQMKPPTFPGRQAFHTPIATWFGSGVDATPAFFHLRFPFRARCSQTASSHQRDLPDTTRLCGGLSFGRVTERQLAADRDQQLPSRTTLAMNCRVFASGVAHTVRFHFTFDTTSSVGQPSDQRILNSGLAVGAP